MSDTPGSLVDKLSICNIKLYHVQEKVNEAARTGEALSAEYTAKLVLLNQQRSGLITEYNQALEQALRTGEVEVDPIVKIL